MSELTKAVGSVIGGVGDMLGLGTATPTIKQTPQVQQDQTINAADDQLRRRQRQGVNANMLSGPGGDSSSSSTGQKTLLGG
ncbi:hypothetical protein [Klebsiella oxytoca]|uniref:hypothetical protein n=1 Tax=Klebsiella oxytoca TaxID=571 RepID=UPI0011592DDB|nr:hypothetical protein [Klebsiella oxytoca]